MADPISDYETLWRYFHILSGITWIGLLYFFNLVNLPLLKFDLKKPFSVDMAEKATANITLKSLFWFRWGAMFTFIFGLMLIHAKAVAFGGADGADYAGYFLDNGVPGNLILLGVVLGTIMWFNVWFIIWPNQQVVLSNNKKIAAGEGDKDALSAENAPRVKNAVMASRFNTWASVPMLFGMVFGAHGFAGANDWAGYAGPIIVLLAVLAAMLIMSNKKA